MTDSDDDESNQKEAFIQILDDQVEQPVPER